MDAIHGVLVPNDRPQQSADNRISSTDSTMPVDSDSKYRGIGHRLARCGERLVTVTPE